MAPTPGVRIPPSPLQKAKNGVLRPGLLGRVFASLGRVRWQVGGILDGTHWDETDEMTPDSRPAALRLLMTRESEVL